MADTDLTRLGAWDPRSGALQVVIETPKGSRNKYKYEPSLGVFTLHKLLPRGMVFPFDFGFVPATQGEDGDPLDVLVLMDEPAFPGCVVPCRLVGVIEAEQTEDGKTERNDRLIAVAEASREHTDVRTLKDLSEYLLAEIEHFFGSYNDMAGKRFKVLGRHGPNRATKLVREGARSFRGGDATD